MTWREPHMQWTQFTNDPVWVHLVSLETSRAEVHVDQAAMPVLLLANEFRAVKLCTGETVDDWQSMPPMGLKPCRHCVAAWIERAQSLTRLHLLNQLQWEFDLSQEAMFTYVS